MSATGNPRGRPPGSVSLTPEIQRLIVNYILAGAYDYAAAEAAGVSARTFRDWMARGEGTHPTRTCTRKLRRFAREVNQAKAQARVAAETVVFRQHPKYWLTRVARSTPEREGWTTPVVAPEEGPDRVPTIEERLAEIQLRDEEEARRVAAAATSECTDGDCPCPYHQRRSEDERQRYLRSRSD